MGRYCANPKRPMSCQGYHTYREQCKRFIPGLQHREVPKTQQPGQLTRPLLHKKNTAKYIDSHFKEGKAALV